MFRILVHDVSAGRETSAEERSRHGPGSTPTRKSSLPHSDLHRGSIYGLMSSRGSEGGKPDDYDEIDQIYDYVRGFAPLPKSAKGWHFIAEKQESQQSQQKEALYQKLTPPQPLSDVENKPPDPPPIETIPGRKNSSMDVTPPMTPPFSPPWSPAHEGGVPMMAPLGPNGQMIGIVPPPHLVMERPHSAVPSKLYEKLGDSKKRQRPKTAEPSKVPGTDLLTPPTRFVKASAKQSNSKHKFFRSRKEKEKDSVPPPMGSLSASTQHLHKEVKGSSQPSFFNMRYKSLTNLAHQVNTSLFLLP